MCGICGYIVTKKEQAKVAKQKMSSLLLFSETRGTDASGIAFVNKEKIVCVKKGIPAHKLIDSKPYLDAIKKYSPNIMIGHARAKTQGDEKDNNNNHPIISGNMAIVHNGVIYNEDDVFKEFKLERAGEVDSEAIVRLIDHFKKNKSEITRIAIQCTCKEVRGNMAIAVINAKNDRELHLVSSGSPCVLAYQKSTGTIFFASTKEILQSALYSGKVYHKFFYESDNKHDFIFRELGTDEAIRLTAEKTSQYKIERYVYSYNKTSSNYDYSSYHRGEHWDTTKAMWVKDTPIITSSKQQSLLPEPKKKEYIVAYDPRDNIKRPSEYCTDHLLDRLNLLEAIPYAKQTINEVNEIKRLENMLNYRCSGKRKEYAGSHDYKDPIKHPDYYTLDQIEERINALEELMENATHTPEEQAEYEELYEYYMVRAEAEEEDEEKKEHKKLKAKSEETLEKTIEKEYEAKADATKEPKKKKEPKIPVSSDMQCVADAENHSLYVDHTTDGQDSIHPVMHSVHRDDYYDGYFD